KIVGEFETAERVGISSGRLAGLLTNRHRTALAARMTTYPSRGRETDGNRVEKLSRTAPSAFTVRWALEIVAPADVLRLILTVELLLLVSCKSNSGISLLVRLSNGM